MRNAEQILKMAHENNGTVTSSQVTQSGFGREYLRILLDKGLLVRSARGVYVLPTVFEDEMFNLQSRFKRGVFSHDSALFLLDLTDRTPIEYSMTFPLNYNTTSLNAENVKYYRIKEAFYDVGVVTVKSPGGNDIRAYNAERTLCDILKGRSETDIQVVTDAFKRYTQQKKTDINLLSEYGRLFRVEKKLRTYLEVLL